MAVQRLLRVPHRTLPKGFGSYLDLIGLRALRSPHESAAEVRRRTALRLAGDVRLYYGRLSAATLCGERRLRNSVGGAPALQ